MQSATRQQKTLQSEKNRRQAVISRDSGALSKPASRMSGEQPDDMRITAVRRNIRRDSGYHSPAGLLARRQAQNSSDTVPEPR